MNEDLIKRAFEDLGDEIVPSPANADVLAPHRTRWQPSGRLTTIALVFVVASGLAGTAFVLNGSQDIPRLEQLAPDEVSMPVRIKRVDGSTLTLEITEDVCAHLWRDDARIDVAESSSIVLLRAVGHLPATSQPCKDFEYLYAKDLPGEVWCGWMRKQQDFQPANCFEQQITLRTDLGEREIWYEPVAVDHFFPKARWLQCSSTWSELGGHRSGSEFAPGHESAAAALAAHLQDMSSDVSVAEVTHATSSQGPDHEGREINYEQFTYREEGRTIAAWDVANPGTGWVVTMEIVCTREWSGEHDRPHVAAARACLGALDQSNHQLYVGPRWDDDRITYRIWGVQDEQALHFYDAGHAAARTGSPRGGRFASMANEIYSYRHEALGPPSGREPSRLEAVKIRGRISEIKTELRAMCERLALQGPSNEDGYPWGWAGYDLAELARGAGGGGALGGALDGGAAG